MDRWHQIEMRVIVLEVVVVEALEVEVLVRLWLSVSGGGSRW